MADLVIQRDEHKREGRRETIQVSDSMLLLLSHFSRVQLFATPARLLCPWDSPGKNTGVGCSALLQGSDSIVLRLKTDRQKPRRTQILCDTGRLLKLSMQWFLLQKMCIIKVPSCSVVGEIMSEFK